MRFRRKKNQIQRTSELLQSIIEDSEGMDEVTIGALTNSLGNRAFGLVMLILAIPSVLPTGLIPGFTTIMGLPMIFIGVQMVMGKPTLWLPRKIANYRFKLSTLTSAISYSIPYVRKAEVFFKPRFGFVTSIAAERFIGVVFVLLAFILALPIPMGNLIPSFAITIIAMGLIERDGLVVSLGIVLGLSGAFLISSVVFFVIKAIVWAALVYVLGIDV